MSIIAIVVVHMDKSEPNYYPCTSESSIEEFTNRYRGYVSANKIEVFRFESSLVKTTVWQYELPKKPRPNLEADDRFN